MPRAVKQHNNHFNVGGLHLTTCDFGEISPVHVQFAQPNEKFRISESHFMRMTPLAVPTFGSFKSELLAFFVPMHTISNRWNAFAYRDVERNGTLPSFTNADVVRYFKNRYVGATHNGETLDEWSALTKIVGGGSTADDSYDFSYFQANAPVRPSTGLFWRSLSDLEYYQNSSVSESEWTTLRDSLEERGVSKILVNSDGYVAVSHFSPILQFPYTTRFIYYYDARYQLTPASTGDVPAEVAYSELNTLVFGTYNTRNSNAFAVNSYGGSSDWEITTADGITYNSGSTFEQYSDSSEAPSRNSTTYYKLTKRGRWLYKVFLSLGIEINWTEADTTELDWLILKAYFRVLYDFIYPAPYAYRLGLAEYFTKDELLVNGTISFEEMMDKFAPLMRVSYDDFYTKSWKTFNDVTGGDTSFMTMQPLDDADLEVRNSVNGTVLNTTTGLGENANTLSANTLRQLKAVADFALRNQIVGNRFYERAKALLGWSPAESKHDFAEFLKSSTTSVEISDVTATTAQFDGSETLQNLGDQGGKGIVGGDGLRFNYDVRDDYGFIIILHRITPSYFYFQGRKPWVKAWKDANTLFTAQFEGLGMQPIPNDEIFSCYTNNLPYELGQDYGGNPNGVFGFAPRYYQYKKGYDFLTGDFRLHSRRLLLDNYHTFRIVPQPSPYNQDETTDRYTLSRPLAQGLDFSLIRSAEYDRIFASDAGDDPIGQSDHIISVFRFDVSKSAPMESMSEGIPFFDVSNGADSVNYEGTQI